MTLLSVQVSRRSNLNSGNFCIAMKDNEHSAFSKKNVNSVTVAQTDTLTFHNVSQFVKVLKTLSMCIQKHQNNAKICDPALKCEITRTMKHF